jgi:hypothetical protein
MLTLILSVLLGLVAGVDPGKGWLYCAYQHQKHGVRATVTAILSVTCALLLSTLLLVSPALIARSLDPDTRAVLLVYGLSLALHGAFKLVFPNLHYIGSLKVGGRGILVWGLINLTWAGYGLPLGVLSIVSGYTPIVGFLAAYSLLSGIMVSLFLKGNWVLPKRVWVNYDFILSLTYLVGGALVVLMYA